MLLNSISRGNTMKTRYLSTCLLAAILVLITACESGAKLRVVNRSSFPAYITVDDGPEMTIAGGATRNIEIDTPTQTILTGSLEKELKVRLVGETYQIYNEFTHAYVDTTMVYVNVGQTLPIYIDPNRASIKIINNSLADTISNVEVYRHNFVNATRVGNLGQILPGKSIYYHVNPSVPTNSAVLPWIPTPATNYYYYVNVILSDGRTYLYGGETNILYKDQQFLVSYAPVTGE